MTWTAPDVTRTGGSLVAGEREMLTGYLAWQRDTFLTKCQGLTGEQLALRPLPDSNLSLLGLIRHLAKVERTWFRQRFAAEPVPRLFSESPSKDADFEELDPSRAEEDYARLLEERRIADGILAAASLDDTFVLDGEEHSLRLVLFHLVSEYARHNGHADLLREHTDGVTGF
ncbi:DinB family protein [Kitasatospora sp. NPDC051914]|uniref:DinB family protein n=1 Tax=Kitasatospora sp. NPDC051914 TaxID=3154945 RepID=UPI003448FE60